MLMRYAVAAIPIALMLTVAPALAAVNKTQHCTLTSVSDNRAAALFGSTGPYQFDIVIDRPNRIDAKATAASLSRLAEG